MASPSSRSSFGVASPSSRSSFGVASSSSRSSFGVAMAVACRPGVHPDRRRRPDSDRFVADVSRRLFGSALQHAQADQHRQRESALACVGVPAQHVARGRDRRRGRAGHAAARSGRRAADQVDTPHDQRRAVLLGARSRLCARRADRPRDLALRVEDARWRPYRQSGRRDPRQLAVLPDARQLLCLARYRNGKRALASRDRQHEARGTSRPTRP